MAKKNDSYHSVSLHAEEDSRGRLRVTLPHEIVQNRALMLWLHHRVLDLLNDNHLLEVVAKDVEQHFELLSVDIISDYIADLLEVGKEAVGASEGQDDGRDEGDEGPK